MLHMNGLMKNFFLVFLLSNTADAITLEKVYITHGIAQDQINLERYYDKEMRSIITENGQKYNTLKISFQDALTVSLGNSKEIDLVSIQLLEILAYNVTTVSRLTIRDNATFPNRTIEEWYLLLNDVINKLGTVAVPTVFFAEVKKQSLIVSSHGECYKHNATRCECFQYISPNSNPCIPSISTTPEYTTTSEYATTPEHTTTTESTHPETTGVTSQANNSTTPGINVVTTRATTKENYVTTTTTNVTPRITNATTPATNPTTSVATTNTTLNSTLVPTTNLTNSTTGSVLFNSGQKKADNREDEDMILIAIIGGSLLFVIVVLYIAFILVKRANRRDRIYPVEPLYRLPQEAKPHLVALPSSKNSSTRSTEDKPLTTFLPFTGNFSVFPGGSNESITGRHNSIIGVNGLSRDSKTPNPVYLEDNNDPIDQDYLTPVDHNPEEMTDSVVKPTFLDVFQNSGQPNDNDSNPAPNNIENDAEVDGTTNNKGIDNPVFDISPEEPIASETTEEQQDEYVLIDFGEEPTEHEPQQPAQEETILDGGASPKCTVDDDREDSNESNQYQEYSDEAETEPDASPSDTASNPSDRDEVLEYKEKMKGHKEAKNDENDGDVEPLYSTVQKRRKVFDGSSNPENSTKVPSDDNKGLTGIERRHSSVKDLVKSFNQGKISKPPTDEEETPNPLLQQEAAGVSPEISEDQIIPENTTADNSEDSDGTPSPPPLPKSVAVKKEFPIQRASTVSHPKRSPPPVPPKRPSFKYI